MDTIVLERGGSIYLTNAAHIVRSKTELAAAYSEHAGDWAIEDSSPFLTWIAGDFVEADNPNRNTQFWTRGDLELAEYTIRYAPLNMLHKFRQPVGFIAATRKVDLTRDESSQGGTMKIQALSALWQHLFPFENQLVEHANDQGTLFYSMECRGSHLVCGGDQGCGEQFEYLDYEAHCEHLKERASIRHIVNPVFRGGALIIPPVQPGWSAAKASIHRDAVMAEAAKFAEANEQQYASLMADGGNLTPAGWESLMASILAFADV